MSSAAHHFGRVEFWIFVLIFSHFPRLPKTINIRYSKFKIRYIKIKKLPRTFRSLKFDPKLANILLNLKFWFSRPLKRLMKWLHRLPSRCGLTTVVKSISRNKSSQMMSKAKILFLRIRSPIMKQSTLSSQTLQCRQWLEFYQAWTKWTINSYISITDKYFSLLEYTLLWSQIK